MEALLAVGRGSIGGRVSSSLDARRACLGGCPPPCVLQSRRALSTSQATQAHYKKALQEEGVSHQPRPSPRRPAPPVAPLGPPHRTRRQGRARGPLSPAALHPPAPPRHRFSRAASFTCRALPFTLPPPQAGGLVGGGPGAEPGGGGGAGGGRGGGEQAAHQPPLQRPRQRGCVCVCVCVCVCTILCCPYRAVL